MPGAHSVSPNKPNRGFGAERGLSQGPSKENRLLELIKSELSEEFLSAKRRGEGCKVCDLPLEQCDDVPGISVISLLIPTSLGSRACALPEVTILHLDGSS